MKRFVLEFSTEGNTEIVDLTAMVAEKVKPLHGDVVVHLFAVGSTVALTTLEFEPGLVKHDLRDLMQRLIPDNATYAHEQTWHDDNGHSHLRAALFGPTLSVPLSHGKILLGEYQQIVLLDFDTRPRRRKVIGTILG